MGAILVLEGRVLRLDRPAGQLAADLLMPIEDALHVARGKGKNLEKGPLGPTSKPYPQPVDPMGSFVSAR